MLEARDKLKEYIERGEDRRQKRLWRIIDSLSFADMQSRQHSISEAFPETYSWALEKDTAELATWLQSGSNMYWVSGKAGSGKSTFMKFLGKNQRTRTLLQEWSGKDNRLVVIECFFWYAGSGLQKSIEGLLRTILYHILSSTLPEYSRSTKSAFSATVPVLFPARWAQHSSIQAPWSQAELQAALQDISRVISGTYPSAGTYAAPRICVFIDGLDEYSGNHGELIRTLEKFASANDTKLCVSSRPWNVFVRAFEPHKPHLSLHDLTREDIRHYVDSSIRQASEPHQGSAVDISSLTLDITRRAEGVFLWVYLVVQSVLQGLDEGDSITILHQRVREFPRDLEGFFEAMLSRVDPVYRHHTAQALYLACLYVENEVAADRSSYLDFELLRRSPSGLQDVRYLWAMEPRVLTDDDWWRLASGTRQFLSSCCKDLLVMPVSLSETLFITDHPSKMKVQFLHRTVYDYLKTTDRIESLAETVPSCLKDGSAFHILNMAKLKFPVEAIPPLESWYFPRQVAFSLDSPWPGLDIKFIDQIYSTQPRHQRANCASIGAAYIAFEQYDKFYAMYGHSTPTSKEALTQFNLEEKHKSWPCLPLFAAALGGHACREYPLTSVNVDLLSFLLKTGLPTPSEEYKESGIKILVKFLASVLPPFLDADAENLVLGWSKDPSLQWPAEPPVDSQHHIHRILQVISVHGPEEWSKGVEALYDRTEKSGPRGRVYKQLLRLLRPD